MRNKIMLKFQNYSSTLLFSYIRRCPKMEYRLNFMANRTLGNLLDILEK